LSAVALLNPIPRIKGCPGFGESSIGSWRLRAGN
jgi:hypothetical protein